MGFLKGLGEFVGGATQGIAEITGIALGGATHLVGELVDSDFVKEIGDSVYTVSSKAGERVGRAVTGVGTLADGIVNGDDSDINEGIESIGSAVVETGTGIIKGVGHIASSGIETIDGILSDDMDKTVSGAKKLVKVAAVGALAVGTFDIIDGVDGIVDGDFDVDDVASIDGDEVASIDVDDAYDLYVEEVEDVHEMASVDDVDIHSVKPHLVREYERADGTVVPEHWRDGDNNPSTTLTEETGGGYFRTNPDGVKYNNLG